MYRTRSTIQALILSQLVLTGCSNTKGPAATTSSQPSTASPTPGESANVLVTTPATATATATSTATASPPAPANNGECRKDADCGPDRYCQLGFDGADFSETGTCVTDMPVYEGRPLLVDGQHQLAPLVRGPGWSGEPMDPPPEVDGHTRAELAASLRKNATEEHASIAAFARTVCELLALGAPKSLIERTQGALADEVRHTEACLEWAARLDGKEHQPGRLGGAVAPFAEAEQLAVELLGAVFFGGCVGETMAAHGVARRAATCPIPELAADLARIADDEARHAALAFDTVTWLRQSSPSLDADASKLIANFRHNATPAERAILFPLLDSVGW